MELLNTPVATPSSSSSCLSSEVNVEETVLIFMIGWHDLVPEMREHHNLAHWRREGWGHRFQLLGLEGAVDQFKWDLCQCKKTLWLLLFTIPYSTLKLLIPNNAKQVCLASRKHCIILHTRQEGQPPHATSSISNLIISARRISGPWKHKQVTYPTITSSKRKTTSSYISNIIPNTYFFHKSNTQRQKYLIKNEKSYDKSRDEGIERLLCYS